jgi:hypothetical protein
MDELGVRIMFSEDGGAPELEVMAPLRSDPQAKIQATLARLHVRPISEFLVCTPLRFIVRAKLTEDDGTPLGHGRTGQLVYELHRQLTADEQASDVPPDLTSLPARRRCHALSRGLYAGARREPRALHA